MEFTVKFIVFVVFATVQIQIGSSIYWRKYGEKEFLHVKEKLKWFDAQTVCQSLGGRLAHINSDAENQFLISLTDKKSLVWLGAADIHEEGDWKWYNPVTPMSFTYWSSAGPQPNNNGGHANCLTYWKSSAGYKWADEPCYYKYPFICEKTATAPKDVSVPYEGQKGGHCMQICL